MNMMTMRSGAIALLSMTALQGCVSTQQTGSSSPGIHLMGSLETMPLTRNEAELVGPIAGEASATRSWSFWGLFDNTVLDGSETVSRDGKIEYASGGAIGLGSFLSFTPAGARNVAEAGAYFNALQSTGDVDGIVEPKVQWFSEKVVGFIGFSGQEKARVKLVGKGVSLKVARSPKQGEGGETTPAAPATAATNAPAVSSNVQDTTRAAAHSKTAIATARKGFSALEPTTVKNLTELIGKRITINSVNGETKAGKLDKVERAGLMINAGTSNVMVSWEKILSVDPA